MKRKHWMRQSRQENLIYLTVWGLLFAAPLLGFYVRAASDADLSFQWMDVIIVWQRTAVYLFLFLIHNFFLAPLLIHRHKRVAYFSIVSIMVVAFATWQFIHRPTKPHPDVRGPMTGMRQRPGTPPFEWDNADSPYYLDKNAPSEQPPYSVHPDGNPPIIGEPDIMAVVMLILMLGANVGIKGYFRSREDRRRLTELEKQNLEQQLEYLRFQINPHFFMNTLNNIHALIDIDPTKAQETIVELSKMMRYILYEGERQGVSLTKEMEFIRTYTKLMRLRYSDKVAITLNLPTEVPDKSLPPLVLISFIENAFKHGISYQHKSFVEISVAVENNMLHFTCRNSKADVSNQEKGGVGLVNVRQRLDLLYPNSYDLSISDETDTYIVELTLPI